MPALVGEVGGRGLVRPRSGYADPLERLADGLVRPRSGHVGLTGRTRLDDLEVGQALAAPGTTGQPPDERFEIHHLHRSSLVSATLTVCATAPAGGVVQYISVDVEA